MLTKEECEEALNGLWFGKLNGYHTLKQLINEHFELKKDYDYLNLKVIEQNMREMNYLIDRNNPPLKFEWFRNKDNYYKPFYDSKEKEWHIFTTKVLNHERFLVDYSLKHMEFEENRFFLKEVKE